MDNTFFAPVSHDLFGELLDYNRLYSFPKIPEPCNGKKVVIDSGAYGLMSQKRQFTHKLIDALILHHEENCKDKNYLLAAPDVPKNPYLSIDFFSHYKERCDRDIKPCFHFRGSNFNMNDFLLQYRYYKEVCSMDFIFMSEKNIRSSHNIDFTEFDACIKMMRKVLSKETNIHFFSSGKSINDINSLFQHDFISCDTTNYQYDAKNVSDYALKWGCYNFGSFTDNCKTILDKINKYC